MPDINNCIGTVGIIHTMKLSVNGFWAMVILFAQRDW